ncbi:hypothetical protein AeRB84_017705 [Aphanomyces euteiches]|nr:hypothetical protein AeRB84_017705 [Aphanomyces euteiches]
MPLLYLLSLEILSDEKYFEFAMADNTAVPPRPSKIAAIANDSNYLVLSKERIWSVPLPVEKTASANDYIYRDVNQPRRFEAFQLYGHKNKTTGIAYVHFGSQLCGAKGTVHGGCIGALFDELLGSIMLWQDCL